MYVCMYDHTYIKSRDQAGKVANPARGQLMREKSYFPVPVRAEKMVSRDGFGSPVPRQPAHLHTQTEYDAFSREFRDGVHLFI